ncbi:DUF4150 domain-containing protein [Vibrio sp. AK197]
MGVTVNANGLSVVHQGSGGEANATLPDVCLTQCGPPVVPIPYGNNAKSADLADGTTTITMDGGNSVAIKGSKFSKSTGDAGGDKKGVASGTIEAEAEFISASPTVKFEGAGVCRLSDQMTMNKANTMCLGGAQNPSVSVSEDAEGTYTVDVKCRYPDGDPFKNADFDITDASGGVVASGHLDANGKAAVSGLKNGQFNVVMKESQDDFLLKPVLVTNLRYVAEMGHDDFFELTSQGQQTFWQPNRISPPIEGWGSMGQSLTADRYFADIVKNEVTLHFQKYHPDFSFYMLAESLVAGIENLSEDSFDAVLAYGLPMILEEGEILSVLFRLPKHETVDHMLAYMRARGTGNPQSYLASYDWESTKKILSNELESLLNKIKDRVQSLAEEASRRQYTYLSKDIFDQHIGTIDTYSKKLNDNLTNAFERLKTKSEQLLSDVSKVFVIQDPENAYSAEAGKADAVVNAILKIDLEEQKWIKICAVHTDLWQTPVYASNLKVTVNNSVLHKDKLELTKTPQRSTVSESVELALETGKVEGGVIVIDNLKANAATVTLEFEGEEGVEKKISKLQEDIEAYLDGLYNTVVEDMKGFQKQWDEEGILCLGDGVIAGVEAWGADAVELFSPEVWSSLGHDIAETTSGAFDKLYIYANQKYEDLKKYTHDAMEDSEEQINNTDLPSWAKALLYYTNVPPSLMRAAGSDIYETIDEAIADVQLWWDDNADDIARKIKVIAKYRKEIWNFPSLIMENDIDRVEKFIDTVLVEFDPELAAEIKKNEFFPKALSLINDHDSVMPYFTYLNLILEAIPPNFYFYYVGKAAAYIAIEIVLTIAIGFVTGPAGAVARISTVLTKLAKGLSETRKLAHAAKALETFTDTVNGLVDILPDYEKLAESLSLRRKAALSNKKVNNTHKYEEEREARNGKCRFCHSSEHKTPRLYRGEIDYV